MIASIFLIGLAVVSPCPDAVKKDGALAGEASLPRILLRERAEVRRSPILLADVAELRAPDELLAALATLELGPAPADGGSLQITPAGVELAARIAQLPIERRHIGGAPRTEVVGRWRGLAAQRLVDEAERFLRVESRKLGGKVLIEPAGRPDAVSLLEGGGEPTFRCAVVGRLGGGPLTQVRVTVMQGTLLVGERPVAFKLHRFGPQLRVLATVRRGAAVAAGDVIAVDGEWTGTGGTPIETLADLDGLVASRDVAVGSVLVREAFEWPVLCQRGDEIRLVLADGPLQIVAIGIAGKAGRRGETIPVTNTTSQRVIQAELVGRRPSGDVVARVR